MGVARTVRIQVGGLHKMRRLAPAERSPHGGSAQHLGVATTFGRWVLLAVFLCV